MKQRERLEVTFGTKDADLWEYIEQTGLPKASVVKQLMRIGIEAKKGTAVVVSAAVPTKVEQTVPVSEKEVDECKPVKDSLPKERKSLFGGSVVKR